jgi:hypothetical protein
MLLLLLLFLDELGIEEKGSLISLKFEPRLIHNLLNLIY